MNKKATASHRSAPVPGRSNAFTPELSEISNRLDTSVGLLPHVVAENRENGILSPRPLLQRRRGSRRSRVIQWFNPDFILGRSLLLRPGTGALLCVFLLLCSFSCFGAGQILINGGGRVIVNGGAIIFNNGAGIINYSGQTTDTSPTPPAPAGDLLHLRDGSALHGQLSLIQTGQFVHWQQPDTARVIQFKPENLDDIHFSHAKPLNGTGGCRVRLVNGDELLAALSSIDSETVELNTWFSGSTKIPRSSVESITFLSSNFAITYEGPVNSEGWTINPTNSWWLRDGRFIGRGNGVISRDFAIKGSSTIEFDMTTAGAFRLMINLYTDKDQLEFGGNSYGLTLSNDGAELRRGLFTAPQGGFGKATWPIITGKSTRHITIQSNKEKKSVALFVDHQLVKRWEDKDGFIASGTRVVFADTSGQSGLVLSNFRASRWDDREPEINSATQTNLDCMTLLNRDRAAGKITGFSEGKLALDLGKRQLNIPLERVAQIRFATTNAPPQAAPEEVRTYLTCFGNLSFKLDKWDTNRVSGHSDVFGALSFPSDSVRQIDFNLNRPKGDYGTVNADEFRGLDE